MQRYPNLHNRSKTVLCNKYDWKAESVQGGFFFNRSYPKCWIAKSSKRQNLLYRLHLEFGEVAVEKTTLYNPARLFVKDVTSTTTSTIHQPLLLHL